LFKDLSSHVRFICSHSLNFI